MHFTVSIQDKSYQGDLKHPIDISIPIVEEEHAVNCFYAPFVEFSPVRSGNFVGSTKEGGLVNFMNVRINPHGNGTHTECVGHIAKESFTINQCLQQFHFTAKLISLYPQQNENGDRIIEKEQIQDCFKVGETDALIIRTLPNDDRKLRMNYSGSNPPYVRHDAIKYMVDSGVQHLLIDLPSVDREEDEGQLLAHKAFWEYPNNTQSNRTITELIYVPEYVRDGYYLLNIQIASFELDVSPSKPILFPLTNA